ncbi:hypothetical protein N7490_002847 [Penicillium lividum]|nr:hypothetical protein N7490_002847 [Penicillium lividum]
MHFNTFATLLFLTPVLANPIAASDDSVDGAQAYAESMTIPAIPNSILTVLETAIPASWYASIDDPTFRSSVISEIEAGTFPAWYIALPSSVKAWAFSEEGLNGIIGAATTSSDEQTATATATTSGVNNAASTATQTAAPSSNAVTSGAASTSKARTSAASVSPSTASSTGGAPVATAGVAMGFAGIAGLLGLAIAL